MSSTNLTKRLVPFVMLCGNTTLQTKYLFSHNPLSNIQLPAYKVQLDVTTILESLIRITSLKTPSAKVVNCWLNKPGQLPSLDNGRLADQLEHSHSIHKAQRGD